MLWAWTLLFLIFINDLADQLTCDDLLFTGHVMLITQQLELRSALRHARHSSLTWDHPLNATKSQYLSLGGPLYFQLASSKENDG